MSHGIIRRGIHVFRRFVPYTKPVPARIRHDSSPPAKDNNVRIYAFEKSVKAFIAVTTIK
jgi:hypothetical protein